VLDDVIQFFAGGIPFDDHFHAHFLKAHLFGLALGTAGTPGGRVADVAFEEEFQFAQLDLAQRGHRGDADAEAAAQGGKDDLAGGRRGVLAEQVQRLVDDDGLVITHVAQRAVLAFHDGVNLVGATALGFGTALLGKAEQAFTVDGAEIGFDGFGHGEKSSWQMVMKRMMAFRQAGVRPCPDWRTALS